MSSALAMPAKLSAEHFERWCDEHELRLDSGDEFHPEYFQLEIVEDFCSGVRELWAILPEGNAKTTLFSLLALYHCDHTPSPWVPVGAASRDQAVILYEQAASFVRQSPALKAKFRAYDGYRKIKPYAGGVGIVVMAADKDTGDGVIPTLALVDELHRHPDTGLYRLWKGKLGKRRGQICTFSTAGEPGSQFEETRSAIRLKASRREWRSACHLRAEGDQLVYHEWAVPKVEQARDLEQVKLANPLAAIDETYLREKLGSLTLDFNEDWLRLTCNIPTRSSYAAIPEADWDACETDERIPKGKPVAVGADFAWLEDTTAIIPLWIRDPQFRLFGPAHILEPPGDGTMLEAGDVKAAFLEIHEYTPIEVVVMDPSKAQDIAQWLSDELGVLVIPRSQSTDWAVEDYESFMEGLRERWIKHAGDEGFREHALSAVRSRLPGDRYRFDRPRIQRKSAKQKRRVVIDALTAAAMVHSVRAGMAPKGDYLPDVGALAADIEQEDEEVWP